MGSVVRKYTLSGIGLQAGIVSLLLLFLLSGCGRAINRTAERRIREALPDLLGPASSYHVHVDGAAERTLDGNLAKVTIDGDNIVLSNGLQLDHLHLELEGVQIDTDHRKVRAIRRSRFEAKVSADSLDEYLTGESPLGEKIRKPRVTFGTGNLVTIAAERLTLGVGVPFQLTGPLHVRDLNGAQGIEMDPNRLEVVGIPLTGLVLHFMLDRFAGATSLSTLPFPVQIREVHTAPGMLTMSGAANVTEILKKMH